MMLLSIGLPFLFGLAMLFGKKIQNRTAKMALTVAMQAVVTLCGLVVAFGGAASTGKYYFTEKLSVGFTADGVSRFFCAIVTVAWLLVTIYATVYMKHEGHEERFFLFSFLTESAMLGAAFSDGLVSMYLFYEMVTLFSMPLVLHSLSAESVAAAKKYLYYSIAGAFLALFGIFVLGVHADTLDFAAGGTFTEVTPLVAVAVFTMCLGFGAKAGLFPLHGWLPTAHPVAPAPASALLSGVIAKAGVLAILRTLYFTVGPAPLSGTWVQIALLCISLLTIFMGSMMAFREKVFKKRLAYSTVSQISYVLCGLFLLNTAGAEGALWQILFHAVVKVGLFLCAGAVIFLYGKTKVTELNGIGRKMPVTFICFTVLSLSLIGIPPTGGFYSKWYLATASLATSGIGALSWITPVVLLASALLTAGYLLDIAIHAFLKDPEAADAAEPVKAEPAAMKAVLVLLALIALAGGLFAAQTQNVIASVL